jgi:ADP-heptose:LPS heptosyltransferase/glycosyltransferase involved in cell wall biosynthesis
MQLIPAMNVGGTERGVLDLVKFFKKADVKNIVVSSGGSLVKELEKEQIMHYRLSVHQKSPLLLFNIPKLWKIIEEEKIDIVHARSRMPAWVGFLASRNSRAHFITTAHGIYKNKFFSEVMGWGKFVICPSGVVARYLKENFGVPEEKIFIINRWVDLNRFKFSEYHLRAKNTLIISIGRISPTKGYEYLIEAFKKIVRFNPYFKLKIIGTPDKSRTRYFEYLKTLVSRFSLSYNVEFTGLRHDIENILTQAHILVAPSVIEESFGRVVIEAFASGTPVVATNIGGFKEIIDDGVNGILVEPKNSEAIAQGILKIFNNPGQSEVLTRNARKKVEQFYTMEKCLRQTENVYKETLNKLRILTIKISSLGDLILTFPAIKAIREKFPGASIYFLTAKKYHSLLLDCPYIDEVITLGDNYKNWRSILNIAKDLRRKSFDYIIDLQNSRSSHLISFFSFPHYSLGFSLRWGFLLNKKVKYALQDNPLGSQEKILELLGIRFPQKKLIFWEKKNDFPFSLSDTELIGINISASQKWGSKNWPAKHIVRLIEMIYKNLPAFKVILLGDDRATLYANEIMKSLAFGPINFCGKTTLNNLPLILKRLKVFITPDTATLHLACALEIPTIALFGPTDPNRHIVKSPNLYVFCEKIFCSFCYKPKCRQKDSNLCLEKISPQRVFDKIKEIVGNK